MVELHDDFPVRLIYVGDEDLLQVLRFFSQLKKTKLINGDALQVYVLLASAPGLFLDSFGDCLAAALGFL